MNCFYFTNVREKFIKSKILQAECFVWCLFVNYSALFCIFMRKAYRFRNCFGNVGRFLLFFLRACCTNVRQALKKMPVPFE